MSDVKNKIAQVHWQVEILSSGTAKWAWVVAELLTEKVPTSFSSICKTKVPALSKHDWFVKTKPFAI